jgi:hypothetical protein
MPAPDSTIEEVRASVLRYVRMYEEGNFTLSDLAAELAIMTSAYEAAIGTIGDEFARLLRAASQYARERNESGGVSQDELEAALTEFRRAAAIW